MKPMKIFLDTNIFIDIQRKRKGWESSFAIIKRVMDGENEGYISALTPVIIYFLRRRITSEEKARKETRDLIEGFKIIGLDEDILEKAFQEERINDFEDAIKFHYAKDRVDAFITRNKSDYLKVAEEIDIFTPEEFLKE